MKVLPECVGGWAIRDRRGDIQVVEGKHKTTKAAKRAAKKQGLKGKLFNIFE